MSIMHTQEDGTEIEVFTADEVAVKETSVRTAIESEYKPKLTKAEEDLADAMTRAGERATEFGQLRKLSEEQVAKLSVAERTIYENQVKLDEERAKNVTAAETAHKSAVEAAIRAKVGTDTKLFDKIKAMYGLVQLEDASAEQIAIRVNAAIGAIGQTEPDLLAAAGFTLGGAFEPPKQQVAEEGFADTERGKEGADELGLITEPPKA